METKNLSKSNTRDGKWRKQEHRRLIQEQRKQDGKRQQFEKWEEACDGEKKDMTKRIKCHKNMENVKIYIVMP